MAEHAEPTTRKRRVDILGFLSRVLSIALLFLMLLLPYSHYVDPTGEALKWILANSVKGWVAYMTIQVLESAQRDFTAVWAWILDSLLAVAALVVGFLVYVEYLTFNPLNPDQQHLLTDAMWVDAADLVTGLLIPIIIAGSVKFREEFR